MTLDDRLRSGLRTGAPVVADDPVTTATIASTVRQRGVRRRRRRQGAGGAVLALAVLTGAVVVVGPGGDEGDDGAPVVAGPTAPAGPQRVLDALAVTELEVVCGTPVDGVQVGVVPVSEPPAPPLDVALLASGAVVDASAPAPVDVTVVVADPLAWAATVAPPADGRAVVVPGQARRVGADPVFAAEAAVWCPGAESPVRAARAVTAVGDRWQANPVEVLATPLADGEEPAVTVVGRPGAELVTLPDVLLAELWNDVPTHVCRSAESSTFASFGDPRMWDAAVAQHQAFQAQVDRVAQGGRVAGPPTLVAHASDRSMALDASDVVIGLHAVAWYPAGSLPGLRADAIGRQVVGVDVRCLGPDGTVRASRVWWESTAVWSPIGGGQELWTDHSTVAADVQPDPGFVPDELVKGEVPGVVVPPSSSVPADSTTIAPTTDDSTSGPVVESTDVPLGRAVRAVVGTGVCGPVAEVLVDEPIPPEPATSQDIRTGSGSVNVTVALRRGSFEELVLPVRAAVDLASMSTDPSAARVVLRVRCGSDPSTTHEATVEMVRGYEGEPGWSVVSVAGVPGGWVS